MEEIFQTIRRCNYTVYKSLINKIDINVVNEYGQSLLHEAISSKCEEIALDLILRGIDINIKDSRGQTVLHFLGVHPNIQIAEGILHKGGDLEIKDMYGNTPLWYAVFNAKGDYSLVRAFMKYNPDIYSKNLAGRSPLDFAHQISDSDLISILNHTL